MAVNIGQVANEKFGLFEGALDYLLVVLLSGDLVQVVDRVPGPLSHEKHVPHLAAFGGFKVHLRTHQLDDDIMDNLIIGPKIRQGIEIGRREGRAEGEWAVVLRLTERRFGAIPDWAKQRIDAMSLADLQDAELRLLDAPDLEDLLR